MLGGISVGAFIFYAFCVTLLLVGASYLLSRIISWGWYKSKEEITVRGIKEMMKRTKGGLE